MIGITKLTITSLKPNKIHISCIAQNNNKSIDGSKI